jgi:tRNA threonylcarbamoyladenosine biosynthesis protein TsaB
MKLLALDTATERCSAALWLDGTCLSRATQQPSGHGELILSMIDELLAEGGMVLSRLDAIAFGRGPGAFTGVRLATSVTQGLAFAADLPVLPISDLAAVAQAALVRTVRPVVLVCQDARMAQVYWAIFSAVDGHASPVSPEQVAAPADVPDHWPGAATPWVGAGSGFRAFPDLTARLGVSVSRFEPDLLPDARAIAQLAAHAGLAAAVSVDAAQPVYLRDQVAVVPSHN